MNSQRVRQALFFGAIVLLWAGSVVLYSSSLRVRLGSLLDLGLLFIFAVLFLQLAFGWASSLAGFIQLLRTPAPPITSPLQAQNGGGRTAILVPIYHEDAQRVFLGIQRVLESLRRVGRLDEFEVFVLSDSQDPNAWVEEEKEWLKLCRRTRGTERVFYRRRRGAIHQKSGNVADFCRRWGKNYRFMIVLDADSVMTGASLCHLVDQMDQNSQLGIVQTLPRQVRARTLFARAQQFGSWLYGPMFAAGSRHWHGISGPYWGHNAIIRVSPFMEFCALPEVPQLGPFHGRFMSHDSVEAAFMRRAGYGVWLNHELEGSYEEGPPDVGTALRRDRRWCRGNMQHVTLLGARGLHWESRVHLLSGVMAYAGGPLWLLFVLLSVSRQAGLPAGTRPAWPGMLLLGVVLVLLFSPKILGLSLAWRRRAKPRSLRLASSVAAETVLSMLLAPVQMISHSYAVLAAIAQLPTGWSGQDRQGEAPAWTALIRNFGVHTLLGLTGLWAAWHWQPESIPWILPVVTGLVVSTPLARCLGSPGWGRWAERHGLFVIPEEHRPPRELQDLDPDLRDGLGPLFDSEPYRDHHGILQVVLDPYVHAAHVALLRSRGEIAEDHVTPLAETLLQMGPQHLSTKERLALMGNFEVLIDLHRRLWTSEPGQLAPWWQMALRHYNEAMALSVRRGTV